MNAPVLGSQIAVGSNISQSQTVSVDDWKQLYGYVSEKLERKQREEIEPLLKQLEADIHKDSVKPSTLRRIGEMAKTWGPVAIPIIDTIAKLIGLRP